MLCAFHKSILNCYPLHHCHNNVLRVHVYRCNYNVLSLHVCVLQKHVQVFGYILTMFIIQVSPEHLSLPPPPPPPHFTGCHGTAEGSKREGSGSAAQGLGAECGGDDLHEHTTTTASPLRQQDCHQGNTPCCYGGSSPSLLAEFTSSEEGKHSDSSSEVCVAQTKVFIVWKVREECSNTSNGV